MFLINAEKTKLSVEATEPLVSGSRNIYSCQFSFGHGWESVTPTIVFRTDRAKVSVLPSPEGQCSIPFEVLKTPMQDLQVGVYGTRNGLLVLPTTWASMGQILPGTTLGEDAQTPEPDIYDQILATATRAEEIAQSIRDDADNGMLGGSGGIKGDPAQLISHTVTYQASDSGTICPNGVWSNAIPAVSPGQYLWTRTTLTFNSGDPVVIHHVTRMGIDGERGGAVSSVNQVSPDASGNVSLTAENLSALPNSGGSMTGPINMQGQTVTGLNDPVSDNDAARKSYVDTAKAEAMAYTGTFVRPNLLDNWYFPNPVNQRGDTAYNPGGYGIDRWYCREHQQVVTNAGLKIVSDGSAFGGISQALENPAKYCGQTMTFSALIDEADLGGGSMELTVGNGTSAGSVGTAVAKLEGITQVGLHTITFTIPAALENDYLTAWISLRDVTTAGKYIVARAAKLELGSTQTLAHQDAEGNWVLNEIPDYADQLRKCQRYYYKLQDDYVTNGYVSGGALAYIFPIMTPVPMRIAPVVSGVKKMTARKATGGYSSLFPLDGGSMQTVDIFHIDGVNVMIRCTVKSPSDTNNSIFSFFINSGLELSAEL